MEGGAAQPGKWHTLPYQKGIMDAMTDPEVERITFMKSARVGYTLMITNLIAYHIHQDKAPILVVQPTIEDAQGYSKDQIKSMLLNTPIIENISPDFKTRDSNNTILRKEFPGMSLMLVGANSARGLRRVSARVVILDEVDGYPPTAGAEGDQITLAARRADAFWNKKIILGSTPAGQDSRIQESYEKSDKRQYYVPCPKCGAMQTLEWERIDFSTKGTVKKPVYICLECDEAIEYKHHHAMIEKGEWRAQQEFTGHAGFHIWAAYSYSPGATWRHIVAEFLASKDNPEMFRGWVNTVRGQVWIEDGERLEPLEIMKRAEDYEALVPAAAGILTAAVDVQKDRLELLVVAWGPDEESWDLEHVTVIGSPAMAETWEKLDAILTKTWTHANGQELHLQSVAIDSGGHFTDQVYAFVRPREVRNIYAIKGDATYGKPVITRPSKPKGKRKIRLYMVGVNAAKDTVYARMRITDTNRGRIHFPTRFPEDFYEQLCAEQKVPKYIRGRRYHVWTLAKNRRNEAWDLQVYNLAALRIICSDVAVLNHYVAQILAIRQKETAAPPPPDKHRQTKEIIQQHQNKVKKHPRNGGFVNRWK